MGPVATIWDFSGNPVGIRYLAQGEAYRDTVDIGLRPSTFSNSIILPPTNTKTNKKDIKDFSKWTIAIHSVEPYYLIELEFIFTGYTSSLKDIAFATIFIFKHRFYI